MAASETEICNIALGHCGTSKGITSLTERSAEARACALFYPQVRDEVQREFPWPFTRRFAALALVAEAPTTEWAYSYRYPAGAFRLPRLLSGMRVDSEATRVPFRLASDDAGQLVYTDLPNAVAEYYASVTAVERFSPDFAQAVALKLAAMIAPTVTKGDPGKLGVRAFQLYQLQLRVARTVAANEDVADLPPESSFILARQ